MESIRYFDTAPHYGLGLSERRLGEALRHRPRSEYSISTKVGRILEPVHPFGAGLAHGLADNLAEGLAVPATHRRRWDFSADGVERSLTESLQRLGLDHVDIVYLHDPDHHVWVPELGGPVDPDNEAHGLTMAVFAQLAKAERKRIQIRVRTAMGAKARAEGRFLGGRPPYGTRGRILEHIPALAAALGISSGTAADDHIAYARTLQQAQATLIYDHNDKTVTADSDDGPIRITIRR